MIKTLLLVFSIISVFSAKGQSDTFSRCETRRIEGIGQFENWLQSKQISSVSESSTVYKVPVVVHILHTGEPIGEGFNYSQARIESQIKTLNEDFRRKQHTPGFNSYPDGGDAQIEFILAQIDPDGNPTNGIVRIDRNTVHLPPAGEGDIITVGTHFSYWDPNQYLNIWCMELPSVFFGAGRFPISDLDGLDTQSAIGDGIVVNALVFGRGEMNSIPNYDMGRTLTHEMGHFLGLLHTFGYTPCGQYSDYCDDTPPMSSPTTGCPLEKPSACDGRPAMIENYMDYSYDHCMNIFTNDQISRMHIVLDSSPRRKSLLTSPVIDRDDVTGTPDDVAHAIKIYPNPATDKLYISSEKIDVGDDIQVTAHTLLGKVIFKRSIKAIDSTIEISVSDISEKIIIVTIEGLRSSRRQLIMIN